MTAKTICIVAIRQHRAEIGRIRPIGGADHAAGDLRRNPSEGRRGWVTGLDNGPVARGENRTDLDEQALLLPGESGDDTTRPQLVEVALADRAGKLASGAER